VADAIAAGEVIERPASAIKELLENACDAGARRIQVEVNGAGLERILVRDDGAGMTPAELPLAFRRHATSKLRTLSDLQALRSYGFRGEALPSLAAVADLECTTRPADAALGARLRLHGQPPHAADVETVGAPLGTSIELRDLFARQPARRRFLPGPRSERATIARVCGETALARPEIALRLLVEGRELLQTPGGAPAPDGSGGEWARLESRRAALAAIWGAETAAAALAFQACREVEPGLLLAVSGLAAPAPHHRGRRDGLRLFVNGRPVSSRRLQYAVEEGYAELLPRRRYPIAAVFLEAPPQRVDANVHPAKATVKLADERAFFRLLQQTLRERLLDQAPSGHDSPAADEHGSLYGGAGIDAGSPPPDFLRRDGAGGGSGLATEATASSGAVPLTERLQRLDALREVGRVGAGTEAAGTGAPAGDWSSTEPAPASAPVPLPERAPGSTTVSAPRGLPGLPLLRLVGQLRATFIVAEGPEGMLLIDQHAAHERVVYERLLARRGAGSPEQQMLLEPALIELSAGQAAALSGHETDFSALGFALEPFGDRALRVRALPSGLLSRAGRGPYRFGPGSAGETVTSAIGAILDDLIDAGPAAQHDPVAASAACHGSVRAGMTLAPAEMAALLHDLEACDNPHTCPHGRPTFVGFPAADLERHFGRR